ncbi:MULTISPECIES: RNA chaperone Hfq [unclassified Halanaerobium]|uniref:RNA chaperone Hfq n=1 Tax=unclassified Halanaerobium TaxID=2641197 RepID=UPI000DF4BF96|nr:MULTISPECIES: RNA chaperone Hfq [unclassified Halanaerobium]RCW51490.1 RNA-binding protein Hfq [Halanaerobium sp. MA284_MarDTE_T2]RCW89278.1 RNA-binding protein Hfq [Halanaerobium sp. DL-01]
MNNKKNYQDEILNHVRENNIEVVVYFVNGYQLKGEIIGYDNFTIILKSDQRDQMIYKHAISTIAPVEKISGLLEIVKEDD